MPTSTHSKRFAALRTWIRAARPFAFTGTAIPILLGAAMAVGFDGPVRWDLLPIVVVGLVLFHAGTNLLSDVGDYARGLDREGKLGGSGVLVERALTPRQVFWAGVSAFAGGMAMAGVLTWIRGPVVICLALVGLAGGVFYGGKRFGYKYYALGDAAVFCLMGPLMAIGAYYVLTGAFAAEVLLASIPVGCLVTAILSGNNYRDAESDRQARVRTAAILLGVRGARVQYCLLVWSAYLAVVAAVMLGRMSPWCLGAILTAPLAIRTTSLVCRARPGSAELATIDVHTAKLHFAFGVILCVTMLL